MKLVMKKITLICPLLVALMGCHDSKNDQLIGFANDFARQASKNMIDSVAVSYPQAGLAEELSVEYMPDSLSVEATDTEDTYLVKFNSKANMVVSLQGDGSVKVLNSYGLFKYPEEKLMFAKGVGAVKPGLSDVELATKMQNVDSLANDLFDRYVSKRKDAVKFQKFTVTHDVTSAADEGTGYIELKNTIDEPISADDYEITLKYTEYGLGSEDKYDKKGESVDIPANGTAKIPVTFYERLDVAFKSVTMKIPDRETFFKNFKPQGDEYDKYVNEHGEAPARSQAI